MIGTRPYSMACSLGLAVLLSACTSLTVPRDLAQVPASRLVETSDLAEVSQTALELSRQLGNDQVLVVFDLDNTLLAMEQDLGSNQWYDWQKELHAAEPCHPMVVGNRLSVQGALYAVSAMRLTQHDGPEQVKKLQRQGLRVIILTSRGADFQLQTLRELHRAGFSFHATAIGPSGGYAEEFIPQGGKRPALYKDGVFLTAGQHKGEMLRALLNKTNTPYPAVIVMADDSLGNLEDVLETFAGSSTSIQAYRYSREDEVVAAFDSEEAHELWLQAEPVLLRLQKLFGTDNYDLPDDNTVDGCDTAQQ